eukprot:COSAG01_NODE_34054_length_554_cov_1.195604_1_plen_33_part_10
MQLPMVGASTLAGVARSVLVVGFLAGLPLVVRG